MQGVTALRLLGDGDKWNKGSESPGELPDHHLPVTFKS